MESERTGNNVQYAQSVAYEVEEKSYRKRKRCLQTTGKLAMKIHIYQNSNCKCKKEEEVRAQPTATFLAVNAKKEVRVKNGNIFNCK